MSFNQMMTFFNYVTPFLDNLTIYVSVFTLIFSFINWRIVRKLEKKSNKEISIILTHNTEQKVLIQTIKRKHLSRSELQGVLANAYQGTERYNISFLSTKEFVDTLSKAQEESNQLTIKIDDQATFNKF